MFKGDVCDCLGIIALGVGPDGSHVRASGWGPAFLDGGSGYDIGTQYLLAAKVTLRAASAEKCTAMTAHWRAACTVTLRGFSFGRACGKACAWKKLQSKWAALPNAGQRALAAVARAVDGRGPPTELVAAACGHCQVESPQDLLG
jgi:N-acetylglucosamine kinase-like BadF-type ATPase